MRREGAWGAGLRRPGLVVVKVSQDEEAIELARKDDDGDPGQNRGVEKEQNPGEWYRHRTRIESS
jgi:hypothetical protein